MKLGCMKIGLYYTSNNTITTIQAYIYIERERVR